MSCLRPPGHWNGRSRVPVCALAFGALLTALASGPARAQLIDEYLPAGSSSFTEPSSIPVLVRPRSDYDQVGVRVGEFIIRPRLDESAGYDDNPIGLNKKRGSAVVDTAATLDVASNFSRNAVNLSLGLINKQFFDLPQQSRTDYTISGGGTLDIGRGKLAIQGSYLALHEDGTQIDSAQIEVPLAYVAKQLQATYTTNYGRWQFEPNLSYLSYRFDNTIERGQTLSQRSRDRDLYSAGVTVRFRMQQNRSLLVTTRAVDTNYIGPIPGLARPNSYAYDVLGGTDFAFSGNLRFLALLGYEVRQFSNAQFKNLSSPVLEASVIWTPSGLTTVTGRASRTIVDSIGESTSGVTYNRGSVNVDHELRRNILLRGSAGLDLAEFAAGGQQTVYHAGAGVTYLANRNLRASLTYSFSDRVGTNAQTTTLTGSSGTTTSGSGNTNGNYTRNVILLTLSALL